MKTATYQGKITVNKAIKDVPSAFAKLFEDARYHRTGRSGEPRKANDVFNEMVSSYYINELGWTEAQLNNQLESFVDMGMSVDGLTLDPDPEIYP
ncbi:MAG: hypothetical protein ACFHVJ_10925 [Aestuariibacter sp.]